MMASSRIGKLHILQLYEQFAANWRSVRKEEEVSVGGDLVTTFGTFEAINVEERLTGNCHVNLALFSESQKEFLLPKRNNQTAVFIYSRFLASWT